MQYTNQLFTLAPVNGPAAARRHGLISTFCWRRRVSQRATQLIDATSVVLVIGWVALTGGQCWSAVPSASVESVARAKELLDTFYGDRENLRQASGWLERAKNEDSNNPTVYVQQARLTVMGGCYGCDWQGPSRSVAYHNLLDKALAIDPKNQKAHILKAEAYHMQSNLPMELASLERAKALGTDDPWLWMGYARYCEAMNQNGAALEYYLKVEALGPNANQENRRAYVSALIELTKFNVDELDFPGRLRKYAASVRSARYAADVWSLDSIASSFIEQGLFDEAIEYSREALGTVDNTTVRRTLAASIYGKAAQRLESGLEPYKAVQSLIDEANSAGFSQQQILGYFQGARNSVQSLKPILMQIVPHDSDVDGLTRWNGSLRQWGALYLAGSLLFVWHARRRFSARNRSEGARTHLHTGTSSVQIETANPIPLTRINSGGRRVSWRPRAAMVLVGLPFSIALTIAFLQDAEVLHGFEFFAALALPVIGIALVVRALISPSLAVQSVVAATNGVEMQYMVTPGLLSNRTIGSVQLKWSQVSGIVKKKVESEEGTSHSACIQFCGGAFKFGSEVFLSFATENEASEWVNSAERIRLGHSDDVAVELT